jgi:hypothetical protein
MKKELKKKISTCDHLGCFGNFALSDPICKKYCALSLRCAIESDQKEQMEILEDLVSSNFLSMRIN